MSVKVTNNAWGTLAAAISPTDTVVPLAPGQAARFPTLTTGDYAWITLSNSANLNEVVKLTAISGDNLTVVRGQDGTTARAFASGDSVGLRPTAALFNDKLDAATAAATYVQQTGPAITNASLLGTTTAVTAPAGTNNAQVATTAFVVATSLTSSLPGQTGNAGKFITTDGTTATWAQVYPSQTGNAGKALMTNGSSTFWGQPAAQAETSQNLTDGATIAWDMSAGAVGYLTLAGNRTMGAPSNLTVRTYILVVTQDAAGSRTLAWNSLFKWPGGVAPTLSTVAGAKDVFSFFSDGTYLYGSYLRGVA